jgi:polar amino acid transport system substrate-binding protein
VAVASLEAVRQEVAAAGVLRAAINFGNPVLAQRDAISGAARGVSVELAHELALRLGVPAQLVTFEAAGKVVEALSQDAWDVAFLAIDPLRAADIAFTAPYVLIEGAYMVRSDATFQHPRDVDQPGIRIAVGKGAAYDLFLTRSLNSATLLRWPSAEEALDAFNAGGSDVAASVRQIVARYAHEHAGLRVLSEAFMTIRQAVATPQRNAAAAAYLEGFVAEMKANGVIARALEHSGQGDVTVA